MLQKSVVNVNVVLDVANQSSEPNYPHQMLLSLPPPANHSGNGLTNEVGLDVSVSGIPILYDYDLCIALFHRCSDLGDRRLPGV